MSRVGRKPITLPKAAKVQVNGQVVEISGPKGTLTQGLVEGVSVKLESGALAVEREGDSGPARARHGLIRALLANAVTGVTEGFSKQLDVIGTGYRGEVKGRELHLALGYSHPVIFPVPKGIDVEIDKSNRITVKGCDRQQVGQVAAQIRSLRSPDPYKGKGIRYANEQLRLKEGKAGAKK